MGQIKHDTRSWSVEVPLSTCAIEVDEEASWRFHLSRWVNFEHASQLEGSLICPVGPKWTWQIRSSICVVRPNQWTLHYTVIDYNMKQRVWTPQTVHTVLHNIIDFHRIQPIVHFKRGWNLRANSTKESYISSLEISASTTTGPNPQTYSAMPCTGDTILSP